MKVLDFQSTKSRSLDLPTEELAVTDGGSDAMEDDASPSASTTQQVKKPHSFFDDLQIKFQQKSRDLQVQMSNDSEAQFFATVVHVTSDR
jgi:hypothetical protein